MPHITTILGNEVGVQHQGVRDESSMTGSPLMAGLMVGKFKRGRIDAPMTITSENIKGTLGYDPKNNDYIAVADALASGVPSVQVLRIASMSLICINVPNNSSEFIVNLVSETDITLEETKRKLIEIQYSLTVNLDGRTYIVPSPNIQTDFETDEKIFSRLVDDGSSIRLLLRIYRDFNSESFTACSSLPMSIEKEPQ